MIIKNKLPNTIGFRNNWAIPPLEIILIIIKKSIKRQINIIAYSML